VESPSLEIFQPRLAAVLCPLLWVTLLGQGVGLGDPRGPCQPLLFCDSVRLSPGPPRRPRDARDGVTLRATSPCSAVMAGRPSSERSMAAKESSWVGTAGTRGWLEGTGPPAPSSSPPIPQIQPAPPPASPAPGSPRPPFTRFRAASSLSTPRRSSRQSWKQSRASASPRPGVPKPLPWGGQGPQVPTAQGPSTHLLVQLRPQGSLEQRGQQVVEPAAGQSGGLRVTPGCHSPPQPTAPAGGTGDPPRAGDRRAAGTPASPVSAVKLHAQVGAAGVAAGAPHRGPPAAVHAHPQHGRHGQVAQPELDGAAVLAGDTAGDDHGDPRAARVPVRVGTHTAPSRAAQSALSRTRARCTVSFTPTSSAKSAAESFACSSWTRILRDSGSLGWRLRPRHGRDGAGHGDTRGDTDGDAAAALTGARRR